MAMKLLNKIFKKGSPSSASSSPNSPSSGDERRNGRGPLPPYHFTATPSSPRTGTVSAAKVLRILGAENEEQENQIIRTMETMAEPDSTDISFEEDYFPANTPSFFNDRRLSDSSLPPGRCSTDTDTFDPPSSRSMSPTSSSRLSPANDPWCRSPQHSPRASTLQSRALPLPIPLRDRVGNNLRVTTSGRPLPQVPVELENLSSAVAARLNNTNNMNSSHSGRNLTLNMEARVPSPLPSPPSSSPLRSFAPHSPRVQQKAPLPLKCQKLQELGRGSFATVFEGFIVDVGSFCAIKVIHDSSMADSFKEVAVLSQLSHQNIVRYIGSCIDENGSFCILLELMKYSLKHILNKLGTGFEESTIRSYTRQILHGLAYLHEHNTIHRDIKSANILVDSQGQVKLADFGVAKQTPEASSLKGTPVFMAPEVMNPNPSRPRTYGRAVDIWSLGCTVLEMATGQAPWSDMGFGFYFKLYRGETPQIPDNLSPVARDFVQKCLKINPDDRPNARQLLTHEFVRDAPSSVPSFSPVMSPRASPLHMNAIPEMSSIHRNSVPEMSSYFHQVEGLRRNGNLILNPGVAREDHGNFSSPLINRTRLELGHQMIPIQQF